MSFSFSKTRKSGGLFDNDDCERPACDDIKKALPSSTEELQAMSQKLAAKKKVQCPPRSAELGRSSWKLLHSMVRVCVYVLLVCKSCPHLYESTFPSRPPGIPINQPRPNKYELPTLWKLWQNFILVHGVPLTFKRASKNRL